MKSKETQRLKEKHSFEPIIDCKSRTIDEMKMKDYLKENATKDGIYFH